MGACPEMHLLFRAAKWLGVAPWELAAQSQAWTDWTLIEMRLDGLRARGSGDGDAG